MKMLTCVLATSVIAGLAPSAASAADLGPYDERATVIERPAPVVVERRYYEPYYEDYYDDAPVVAYYGPRYRRPYFAHYYPYRFGPYYHHRRYWGHRGRW